MTVYEVVIEGKQGTNDMLNVVHYDVAGIDPPSWADVATVIRGHLEDHIAAVSVPIATWSGITVREDTPGSVGVTVPFSAGVLTGSIVDPDNLKELSMLVHKRSLGMVRPVLGWAFHGGLSARWLGATGAWEAGAIDAVEDFWEDIRILNVAGPSTLTMVIKASDPTQPNTQAYTPVDLVDASTTPRTLRRRRTGLGS